ncbi:MAG TPA: universal stress protein [Thermomicrobiales bacterium]|nr:universal stress protein [Thermomicrobiales bacterium]
MDEAAPRNLILVPLDLSRPGEAKLPVTEQYARALDAEVLLLHVLPGRRGAEAAAPAPERADDLDLADSGVSPEEARAQTYLDTVTTRLRAAGLDARALVRVGPVAATVLATAREEGATLLILGSTVRQGLSRLRPGSVAEAIVRDAPCPVLLVRPSDTAVPAPPPVRVFAEDATRAGLLAPRRLGVRTVDVARIIGSVGRADDLGPDFRPRHPPRAEQQRYDAIVHAGEYGRPLPPVELYKLGYGYYVLDGHRRLAAARQLGQPEIDAEVTEFVPLHDRTARDLFHARRAFEQATGLTRVGAARPETYAYLRELIDDFARRHDLADPREAAQRWYSSVFRPLARRMHLAHLHRLFPGERSADLLARLARRRDAAERLGHELDWTEALQEFAAAARQEHEDRRGRQ